MPAVCVETPAPLGRRWPVEKQKTVINACVARHKVLDRTRAYLQQLLLQIVDPALRRFDLLSQRPDFALQKRWLSRSVFFPFQRGSGLFAEPAVLKGYLVQLGFERADGPRNLVRIGRRSLLMPRHLPDLVD